MLNLHSDVSTTDPGSNPFSLSTSRMYINAVSPSVFGSASSSAPIQPTVTYPKVEPITMKQGFDLTFSPSNPTIDIGQSVLTKKSDPNAGSMWATIGRVASEAINLGGNVLLNKYAPVQPTAGNQTNLNNPKGVEMYQPPPVVFYDPARSSAENQQGIETALSRLVGSLFNTTKTPSGEVQSVTPSINGIVVIGLILLAVFLVIRGK